MPPTRSTRAVKPRDRSREIGDAVRAYMLMANGLLDGNLHTRIRASYQRGTEVSAEVTALGTKLRTREENARNTLAALDRAFPRSNRISRPVRRRRITTQPRIQIASRPRRKGQVSRAIEREERQHKQRERRAAYFYEEEEARERARGGLKSQRHRTIFGR